MPSAAAAARSANRAASGGAAGGAHPVAAAAAASGVTLGEVGELPLVDGNDARDGGYAPFAFNLQRDPDNKSRGRVKDCGYEEPRIEGASVSTLIELSTAVGVHFTNDLHAMERPVFVGSIGFKSRELMPLGATLLAAAVVEAFDLDATDDAEAIVDLLVEHPVASCFRAALDTPCVLFMVMRPASSCWTRLAAAKGWDAAHSDAVPLMMHEISCVFGEAARTALVNSKAFTESSVKVLAHTFQSVEQVVARIGGRTYTGKGTYIRKWSTVMYEPCTGEPRRTGALAQRFASNAPNQKDCDILGFIAADGTVRATQNKVGIGVCDRDFEYIEGIVDFWGGEMQGFTATSAYASEHASLYFTHTYEMGYELDLSGHLQLMAKFRELLPPGKSTSDAAVTNAVSTAPTCPRLAGLARH